MSDVRPWYYISFANTERFLGGCYVRTCDDPGLAADAMLFATERRGDGTTLDEDGVASVLALAEASRLGINPGGAAEIVGPFPTEVMDECVPLGDRERLLTREEIK